MVLRGRRGSAGYGKTWLQLDNGMRREDSVRDIGALLDWIAEQMVAALREQGSPVWYMNALNEGHGYRKKENRDLFSEATVLFLETWLLD